MVAKGERLVDNRADRFVTRGRREGLRRDGREGQAGGPHEWQRGDAPFKMRLVDIVDALVVGAFGELAGDTELVEIIADHARRNVELRGELMYGQEIIHAASLARQAGRWVGRGEPAGEWP